LTSGNKSVKPHEVVVTPVVQDDAEPPALDLADAETYKTYTGRRAGAPHSLGDNGPSGNDSGL